LPLFTFPAVSPNQIDDVYLYFILLFFYTSFWTFLFCIILMSTNSILASTLKMTGLWLLFCILIPGAVHSYADYRYPLNFMGEYLNASREEVNKLWELPADSLEMKLVEAYPQIKSTKHFGDSLKKEELISYSSSALANILLKKVFKNLEAQFEPKNCFIRSTYWFNPVGLIENSMNAKADNDFYAFARFRNEVQLAIDTRIEILLIQLWNGDSITKEKFLNIYSEINKE